MISIDSLHSNQNNHLMADTRETVLMKGDDPTFAMNLHVSSSAAVLFCSLQVWCFFECCNLILLTCLINRVEVQVKYISFIQMIN
jgi:hypothetical protein